MKNESEFPYLEEYAKNIEPKPSGLLEYTLDSFVGNDSQFFEVLNDQIANSLEVPMFRLIRESVEVLLQKVLEDKSILTITDYGYDIGEPDVITIYLGDDWWPMMKIDLDAVLKEVGESVYAVRGGVHAVGNEKYFKKGRKKIIEKLQRTIDQLNSLEEVKP